MSTAGLITSLSDLVFAAVDTVREIYRFDVFSGYGGLQFFLRALPFSLQV